MLKTKKGFTLIELMIVVAIIGILAVVAVPTFIHFRNRSIVAMAVGTCESIRPAMAAYASSSPSNLFPVDQWADGEAGWDDFRTFMIPMGGTFKASMKEQGFKDFIYRTIELNGEDGTDYFFVFESAGVPPEHTGAMIEVRLNGITRWSGTL